MSRAVIFVNGRITDVESVRSLLHPDDTLLAADGGTRFILSLGLVPSTIIGDLDSLTKAEQISAKTSGCRIIQRSRDKNETDLELALYFAIEAGHREILVIGALGGRLDQTLANLSVLTGLKFADLDIYTDDGKEATWFVRDRLEIQGKPGDIVSLIPWGGEVTGVTTAGLRWPLSNESLFPDRTRGISNELLDETATISLHSGLLLIVRRHNQLS